MTKAFTERPRWQRWLMIIGWIFIALVVLTIIAGQSQRSASPADLSAYRQAFARLALPCDAAQMRVGASLQDISGDSVGAAQAVQAMDAGCTAAWLGIGDLERPDGLSGAQDELADKVELECKQSFYLRKKLAEALLPVVDGDRRPSVMAGLQSGMTKMKAASDACGAALDALAPSAATSG